MCADKPNIFQLPALPRTTADAKPATPHQPGARIVAMGSRRRRLWELGEHAHCPVIGVCLNMATVRKLVGRITPVGLTLNDYELHCVAVTESRQRKPLSEAIQKELDHRHAQALRHTARLKCTDALIQWWQAQAQGPGLGEALWVTLTHPRCTPELEYRVLGHVHMLQHQIGMASRVDQTRFDELLQENSVLARHLATVQARCTALTSEHAARLDASETALMRARAEILARDTEIAQLREQIEMWRAASPDLPERLALSRDKQAMHEQNQSLRRQLRQAREALARSVPVRPVVPVERLEPSAETPACPLTPATPISESPLKMDRQAVLCVGGRPAIVPLYRQIVEHTGARFLHHDGGEQDNPAQLDATLAAADLVICQTGCVSHNAYWRVKDHCKRTGKRCLFIDTPSQSALRRALSEAIHIAPLPGRPQTTE